MLTRHASREMVLQALFNYDFRAGSGADPKDIYKNIKDSLYENEDMDDAFSKIIFFGVLEQKESIDKIITEATPEWGLERTAITDRNILRLAIYEMLYSDRGVPPRVAINEAIELAKSFGHKRSYRFVSGVLGSIYEASGLKDKDVDLNKKRKHLVEKVKVGAVPYMVDDKGTAKFLLVHNIFGKWTLPKGTADTDAKTVKQGLKGVLEIKLNAQGKTGKKIGENSYKAGLSEEGLVKKGITYYLFEVSNPEDVVLNPDNKGLNNIKWFTPAELAKAPKYEDLEDIINKGVSEVEVKLEKNK